jgi:opacity protein-like surface antigen
VDFEGGSDKKARKIWVGLSLALDVTLVPSENNVCKLLPPSDPSKPLQPVNGSNYYCVSDGSDYPYRPLNAADVKANPRGGENDRLVLNQSDKVSGGGALGNVRLLATLDYALNHNLLVGLRAGVVLNTYPGNAAKDDGKAFPPIHLELRGTYLFGKDALVKPVAPYVMAGAGIATFETSVKVRVAETTATNTKVERDVDAWQLAGPGFITAGGGVRIGLNERLAMMLGARLNLAFGNSFAPSFGPDLGIAYGF